MIPRPGRMWSTLRSVVRFRPIELDPVARRLRGAVTVDDLRRRARRRLPSGVFDYIDGGAGDERSLRWNAEAFSRIEFRPNVMRDVSALDTSTVLFGRTYSMPLVLAPTGYTRLTHSAGELSVARAAERADVAYSLSTMSTRSIEEIAAASNGPKWFQVYTWKDRGLVAELIGRAAAAGFEALWLTVDTAVLGNRERDTRRGFTMPPRIGPGTIVDGIVHPAWTWDFIRHEPLIFANVATSAAVARERTLDGTEPMEMAQHVMHNFDQKLAWADVEWIRSLWSGPLVLKGIQTVADAEQAARLGVDGIALSNHGGRQLDGAPAPIELVEPVRQALGERATIICDGGVRRGDDIVKAIALGADACAIGRPYLYGAAVAGERGVDHVLAMFRTGLERTMALCGRTSIADIDRQLVRWR